MQNRRGEGVRLRGDIVSAASAILEETGNEDAITLRGVARRVGIAAPSIYGHFADADAIIVAVLADTFEELDAALRAATGPAVGSSGATSPRATSPDPLRSLCAAYLDFARTHPHRYRVLFARHRTGGAFAMTDTRAIDELAGAQAFHRLVASVAIHTGTGPDRSTIADATALWVALHGYASLQSALPAFPWPDAAHMLDTLIERLVPGRPPSPNHHQAGNEEDNSPQR